MVQEKIPDDAGRYMLAFAPQDSGRGTDFSDWMNDLDRVINGDPNSLERQNAVQRLYYKLFPEKQKKNNSGTKHMIPIQKFSWQCRREARAYLYRLFCGTIQQSRRDF
ncbi:hypothetical protein ACX8XN_02070 [Calditrichota bacterium GD2]